MDAIFEIDSLPSPFLVEDQVVDAVCAYLDRAGWADIRPKYSHERGNDIEASLGDRRLFVEAKGAGSARATSKRHGQPFERKQVYSHVGVATVRALRWVASGDVHAALAFPDNEDHRQEVVAMLPVLKQLNVTVFWVAADLSVSVEGASLPTL
ncbi:hypothetical protein [Cellulomonas sp. HZM]|uniref:hypothetical protein n=1 Tax=Cellulomonas sp. HZM TaxID=1454010 RepID=UPI000492FB4E|nr:hypothetical protein [Cellulomonas sp. HZM]